jgi:hypothetical protein
LMLLMQSTQTAIAAWGQGEGKRQKFVWF